MLMRELTFWTWMYFWTSFGNFRKCLNIRILKQTCSAMNFHNDLASSSSACLIRSWKGNLTNCEQLYLSMLYAIVLAVSSKTFCCVYAHAHSNRDSWVDKGNWSHSNISLIIWSTLSASTNALSYASSPTWIGVSMNEGFHHLVDHILVDLIACCPVDWNDCSSWCYVMCYVG